MNNMQDPSVIGDMAEIILKRYDPPSSCNAGVLFLLSKNDHAFYLYSGKAALDIFDSSRRNDIFNMIKPHLKYGDYDKAIISAVE